MKKWAKYLGLTAGIALFIFLMLPFLEPPTLNKTETVTQEQAAAKPQIFTSNPLTEIVKRVARFFNKQPNTATAKRANARAAAKGRTPETLYAAAPAERINSEAGPAVNPADMPDIDPDEANAKYFLPDEEDEWALIRQRAPETSQSGMHEISIKDNAYEQFLKQERVARYVPASVKAKTEVPDSKLARLFNPIKNFFGFGPKAAASGALQADTALASASATGASSGLGNKNQDKPTINLPRPKDVHDSFRRISKNMENVSLPLWRDPHEIIRDAAQQVADSLPGDPNSPQGKQAREETIQTQTDKYNKLWKERMTKDLLAKSNGEAPKDVLPETTLSCHLTSGLLTDKAVCFDMEKAEQLGEQNRAYFEEKTRAALPKALTPVLGVANSQSKEQIAPDLKKELGTKDPEYKTNLAIRNLYKFMLDKNNCHDDCFWVSNEASSQDTDLVQTIKAAGMELQGDPLHKFEALKKEYTPQFIKEEMDAFRQSNPTATEEQLAKQEQELKESMRQAVSPYVLYTSKDMAQLANQIEKQGQQASPLYFANAADALAFAKQNEKATNYYYGTVNHETLSRKEDTPPSQQAEWESMEALELNLTQKVAQQATNIEKRSRTLINQMISNSNVRQGIADDINADAAQQSVTNQVKEVAKNIQEEMAQKAAQVQEGLNLYGINSLQWNNVGGLINSDEAKPSK